MDLNKGNKNTGNGNSEDWNTRFFFLLFNSLKVNWPYKKLQKSNGEFIAYIDLNVWKTIQYLGRNL